MIHEKRIVPSLGTLVMVQAQPADLSQVIDILEEAAQWLSAHGIDQWRPGWFQKDPFQAAIANRIEQGLVYLARCEDKVLGTITLQWTDPIDVSLWKEIGRIDEAGYIHRLAIRRAWAGLELGQYLLQWAEKVIADTGKSAVRLDCMPENDALCAYYERAGFICQGERQGQGWKAKLYEKIIR